MNFFVPLAMNLHALVAALLLSLPTVLILPLAPMVSAQFTAQQEANDQLRSVYRQMIDSYEQNLAAARQSGQRLQEVDVMNGAGIAYRFFGEYQKSADVLEAALKIARAINDSGRESMILQGLGATYSKLGDYLGVRFYEQQWQQVKQNGSLGSRVAVLQNLGLAYMQIVNYPKVIEVYEQYIPLIRQVNDPFQEEVGLGLLSTAYRQLGEAQKYSAILEQRLALARRTKNLSSEWTILNEQANFVQQGGRDLNQAIVIYQQMLQIGQRIGQVQPQTMALTELAVLYTAQNKPQAAIAALEQALSIARAKKDSFLEALILEDLSQVYGLIKDYNKAIELQKQSLEVYRVYYKQAPDQSLIAQAIGRLGMLQFQANQLQEAESTLKTALDLHNRFRESVLKTVNLLANSRDDINLALREQGREIYQTLQRIYILRQQTELALETAEEGRARAFIDLLLSGPQGNRPAQDLSVVSRPTIAQLKQIAKAQNSTLVQYSIFYEDKRSSRFNLGKHWSQSILPSTSQIFIWVIKPNGDIAFRQVDSRAILNQFFQKEKIDEKLRTFALGDLVANARGALGTGDRGFAFNENTEALNRVTSSTGRQSKIPELRLFHQLLIEPIVDLLPTNANDRVTFIPQDELFLTPFAALQDAAGKYLVEKHTILLAPSIQVLALTRQQRQRLSSPGGTGKALVVGNPTMPSLMVQGKRQPLSSLPGSEKEAKEIAQLLKTNALIGKTATETAIVQQMPQARIIHLATHGLLDVFNTARSERAATGFEGGLALAPTADQDGFLTTREILNLKLQAELVTLSACDTGRGRVSGDGVIGLSRSFIAAGTPSVIVSLWKVPDAPTASLMTEFYQNWQKNPDKAQALRQAMLTTAKQYPDPKDWAAFVLIGEAD
ncbi:MAG: CHAT domain-containing tetratricopeptide repeat protein [Leptolyngbyaceae cyanobacterium bins.59]|nr:CHAT domain-containing tetratricopeptide repeat protein [Leptolyngbyaceae cyanobacterium bins.59]